MCPDGGWLGVVMAARHAEGPERLLLPEVEAKSPVVLEGVPVLQANSAPRRPVPGGRLMIAANRVVWEQITPTRSTGQRPTGTRFSLIFAALPRRSRR